MNIQEQFPLATDIIHLNHAAVGPWPLVTRDAVTRFADENLHHGSRSYLDWLDKEQELRKKSARLINAKDPDDIALVKNTSEGLSMVAYGIDWNPGDNLVLYEEEFPSNRIVWESLSNKGVNVHIIEKQEFPEQAMIKACDERTRLITVSSVQYSTGLRMDLAVLGQFCKKQNILFCVDAIQSLGALEFNLDEINADFVIADGHKWLLAPEGIALFYSSKNAREQLSIHEFGWHMTDQPGNYNTTEWSIARSARRFECGSPNMISIHALEASISLLLDIGLQFIEKEILDRNEYIQNKFSEIGRFTWLSSLENDRRSGIITVKPDYCDPQSLYQWLMRKNVICAARGGGVRFSPHFYTPYSNIDKLFNLLNQHYREMN